MKKVLEVSKHSTAPRQRELKDQQQFNTWCPNLWKGFRHVFRGSHINSSSNNTLTLNYDFLFYIYYYYLLLFFLVEFLFY